MRQVLCLVLSALVLFTSLPAGAGHDDGPSAFDELRALQRQSDRQAERLERSLAEMDALAAQLPPCSVRDELLRTIERTRQLAERMERTSRDTFALVGETMVVVAPPPPVFAPEPMSDEEFARIRGALSREWWDDGRQTLLAEVSRDRLFSVAQVRRIMEMFTFGDGKVGAAVTMYGRTVDRENWYLVYDGLTFGSEKDELRRRVAG